MPPREPPLPKVVSTVLIVAVDVVIHNTIEKVDKIARINAAYERLVRRELELTANKH